MCPAKSVPNVLRTTSLAASPQDLRRAFFSLATQADLAALLEVREKDLIYYAVRRGVARYRGFLVAKRSKAGGTRTILEPVPGLKAMQSKLLQVFTAVYSPPMAVHGFVPGRSIATGALQHEPRPGRRRELLTLDLADFFGTVNFGRVWGLLQAKGYERPRSIATLLAQLTVHEDQLPQGAPTSPILANMIAARMDRQLSELSIRRGATYTRYADDLTFSSEHAIPANWIDLSQGVPVAVGALRDVIESNGFKIAEDKTRYVRGRGKRLVTGLVVNERVNVSRRCVRQIRAMLHAWEEHSERQAATGWTDHRDRRPGSRVPKFRDVVRGRIAFVGMVRGVDDPVYERLYRWYCRLAGTAPTPIANRPWNHLRRAEDAIWVYESDTDFGTAVFTELGLITCAHVLGKNAVVFHPRRASVRVKVTPKCYDKSLDLALLNFGGDPPFALSVSSGQHVRTGDELRVRGYPHYNAGQTLVDAPTNVVGHRRFAGVPRFLVAYNLHKGMSGGAVVDDRERLVGIIATHAQLYNSVIPAAELWTLLNMCSD